MKMPTPLRAFLFTAALAPLCLVPTLCAEETSSYVSENKLTSEVFSTKVLKIYECKEDGVEYKAYVVDWRGHEVVINDASLSAQQTKIAVGDTVRCRMMQMQYTTGGIPKIRMSFAFVSEREGSGSEVEAILNEVRERRLKRQEAKTVGDKK